MSALVGAPSQKGKSQKKASEKGTMRSVYPRHTPDISDIISACVCVCVHVYVRALSCVRACVRA